MSGAYYPDVLNPDNRHNVLRIDRRLSTDDGEGSTMHDIIGDMSLNPEQLLMQKEEDELDHNINDNFKQLNTKQIKHSK